ncbi:unnamed protein product, partial [Owenia fusiformis]
TPYLHLDMSCKICTKVLQKSHRFFIRRILHNSPAVYHQMQNCNLTTDAPSIVIPKKIKRDELSILQALASTVERDTNAPAYQYMDDPFFQPTSLLQKKSYSLAKASGKKAAHYVMDRWPWIFEHGVYKESYFNIPEVWKVKGSKCKHDISTLDGLEERLERRMVGEAFQAYRALTESGIEIPQDICLQLLDLQSIFNGSNVTEKDLPPEEMFYQDPNPKTGGGGQLRETWRANHPAEVMFENLTEKTPEAYASIIKGMVKYSEAERAYQLYTEMLENNIPVDVSVYNAVILISFQLKDMSAERWDQVITIMEDMKKANVAPNLETFNNALQILGRMPRFNKRQGLAIATINEMIKCGIEPSLGTFTLLLKIFYAFDDNNGPILGDIISYLESKGESILRSSLDLQFFSTAMSKIAYNMHDVDMAHRLHALLNVGENIKFLSNANRQMNYYNAYFKLVCMFQPIGEVMALYEELTPNIWSPSGFHIQELLQCIKMNHAYEHLPIVWSDLILFEHAFKPETMSMFVEIMALKKQDVELQQQFANIALRIMEKKDEEIERKFVPRPLELSGQLLGQCAVICARAEMPEKAESFIKYYLSNQNTLRGTPSVANLEELEKLEIIDEDTIAKIQGDED